MQEAVDTGARKKQACELIGITIRTLQNWESKGIADKRKGAEKQIPSKLVIPAKVVH